MGTKTVKACDARPMPSCVLIVEDSFFIADELASTVRGAGCDVIGPAPTVRRALDLLEPRINAALLDVNLADGDASPVAERLTEMGVPFAFLTGYDTRSLPERFRDRRCIEKPVRPSLVIELLQDLAAKAK